jgi:hypothetical protein
MILVPPQHPIRPPLTNIVPVDSHSAFRRGTPHPDCDHFYQDNALRPKSEQSSFQILKISASSLAVPDAPKGRSRPVLANGRLLESRHSAPRNSRPATEFLLSIQSFDRGQVTVLNAVTASSPTTAKSTRKMKNNTFAMSAAPLRCP